MKLTRIHKVRIAQNTNRFIGSDTMRTIQRARKVIIKRFYLQRPQQYIILGQLSINKLSFCENSKVHAFSFY